MTLALLLTIGAIVLACAGAFLIAWVLVRTYDDEGNPRLKEPSRTDVVLGLLTMPMSALLAFHFWTRLQKGFDRLADTDALALADLAAGLEDDLGLFALWGAAALLNAPYFFKCVAYAAKLLGRLRGVNVRHGESVG